MNRKNILIAEDEPTILRINKNYFEKEGYCVYTAVNGEEAINVFKEVPIDLVCLDVMMPKLNGFETARIIRSSSQVPIIIITALQNEDDILKGYSLRIDDYITKPYNPKVLMAKVKNILLRAESASSIKVNYQIGELSFDFVNNLVSMNGVELSLTQTEFKLLSFLAKNNNKTCSRELLLDEIWGMDVYVDDRIIDAYIKKLRKIISPKKYIKTVFGTGYRFSVEEK